MGLYNPNIIWHYKRDKKNKNKNLIQDFIYSKGGLYPMKKKGDGSYDSL